jgi:hypothetical protein
MGWENAPVDDTATIDRWQWRMKTPKSEADSAAPSFKDVWQTINPLQHIPIIGSIYRALTGDVPTPTARALGGMLYAGPVGAILAGVAGAVTEIAGGDPIEKSVARLNGTREASTEVAAATPPAETPAPVVAGSAAPVATSAAIAAVPAARVAAPGAPTALRPPAVEPAKELAKAPVAAEPVDPYARFQPKRTTVQHGNRIAQNLAALNMAALTAPPVAEAKTAAAPQPVQPSAAKPAPTPTRALAGAPTPVVDKPVAAAPPLDQARNFATAGAEPTGQTPQWFSQAVIGALDRYREAGGLRPPVATAKAVDARR